MPRSSPSLAFAAVVVCVLGAACHHAPAVAPAPAVVRTDDSEARLARVRADSIARADAARRDALARASARADSIRRAGEMARNAEAAARADLVGPVHFDFDLAEIRSSDRAMLDRKAAVLATNRGVRIRIDGNTDERGSDEYNIALGMRRAAAARRYLMDRGVDESRIDLASNGEERSLCQQHDESCWSQNRRDEFVIIAGGDRIVASR